MTGENGVTIVGDIGADLRVGMLGATVPPELRNYPEQWDRLRLDEIERHIIMIEARLHTLMALVPPLTADAATR